MGCRISGHDHKSKNADCKKCDKSNFSKFTSKRMTAKEGPNTRENQTQNVVDNAEQEMKNNLSDSVPNSEYMYDINISCHEKQLDWVEANLLPIFEEKLKLRCFLFDRDRPAGLSTTQTIEDSIKHSRRIIICFSHDYLLSSWKRYEVLMVHHSDPLGLNRGTIPILLDDCELPSKYSGFTSLRWPSSENVTQFKFNMRLKFFWTNLIRSLDMEDQFTEENWWQNLISSR